MIAKRQSTFAHCKLVKVVADRFVLFICPALHRVGDVRQVRDSWKALAEESWQESQGFQVAEVSPAITNGSYGLCGILELSDLTMLMCSQVNTCHNHHLVERFNITDTTIIMFRDSMVRLLVRVCWK